MLMDQQLGCYIGMEKQAHGEPKPGESSPRTDSVRPGPGVSGPEWSPGSWTLKHFPLKDHLPSLFRCPRPTLPRSCHHSLTADGTTGLCKRPAPRYSGL
jgi:hypothetical protein